MGQRPSGLRAGGGKGCLGRRGHVRSASKGRWRMLPTGCLSVTLGAPNDNPSYYP